MAVDPVFSGCLASKVDRILLAKHRFWLLIKSLTLKIKTSAYEVLAGKAKPIVGIGMVFTSPTHIPSGRNRCPMVLDLVFDGILASKLDWFLLEKRSFPTLNGNVGS